MDKLPLMKCGHTAQGVNIKTNRPVCTICANIDNDANIIDNNPPSLEGRKARCSLYGKSGSRNHGPIYPSSQRDRCKRNTPCLCEVDSDISLSFFEYRRNYVFDIYYCGCSGWE